MEAKDELNELFRSRFQGHEMAVEPGLWTVIAAQLAATAPLDDEGLRDLFQERFHGHETDVDPGVWEGISSQLGQGAAAGGWSIGSGWAAAGVGVLAIAGASWWALRDEPASSTTPKPEVAHVVVAEPSHANPEPLTAPQVAIATEPFTQADPRPRTMVEGPRSGSATMAGAGSTDPAPKETFARAVPGALAESVEEPHAEPNEVAETFVPARTEAEIQEGLRVVEAILADMATRPDPSRKGVEERSRTAVDLATEEAPVLEEEAPAPPSAGQVTLFIPNVFTPNDDLENDRLEVQGAGFERVTVRIFSASTGAKVFEANDLRAWDGFDLNGRRCPEGHYFYAIEAVDAQGHLHTRGQVIMLSR